jgi:hypothetical protein
MVNDKGLRILGTHVKNILRTHISYLCSLCRCLQIFHNVTGEHKAHVVQVNDKNNKFFN